MLLFDSVGHYFRLRREMLSGSRFTDLLPLSPRFFLHSPRPFPLVSPFHVSVPLLASSATDNPKREKYVEFPGQPHEGSNATPVFVPRFRCSYHRHSTRCLPFSSTWTNNIRENCLIPKYTHPLREKMDLSNDRYNPIRKITMGFLLAGILDAISFSLMSINSYMNIHSAKPQNTLRSKEFFNSSCFSFFFFLSTIC